MECPAGSVRLPALPGQSLCLGAPGSATAEDLRVSDFEG